MKYAIPSKWRAGICTTQNFFRDAIFFVEPQDFDLYVSTYPNHQVVNIWENNRWVWFARSFIFDYFSNEKQICVADDDITWLKYTKGSKQINLYEYIENAQLWDYVIWAPASSRLYAYYFSKNNICQKCAQVYVINMEKIKELWVAYDPKLKLFEDMDLLMQIAEKWWKWITWSDVFLTSFSQKLRDKWMGVWWCTSDWKQLTSKECVDYICKKWWKFVWRTEKDGIHYVTWYFKKLLLSSKK